MLIPKKLIFLSAKFDIFVYCEKPVWKFQVRRINQDPLISWPRLPLKNYNGACQAFMYASYMFRFMSAWFIVIFAVER